MPCRIERGRWRNEQRKEDSLRMTRSDQTMTKEESCARDNGIDVLRFFSYSIVRIIPPTFSIFRFYVTFTFFFFFFFCFVESRRMVQSDSHCLRFIVQSPSTGPNWSLVERYLLVLDEKSRELTRM